MWIETFIGLLLAQFSPHEATMPPSERQFALEPRVEWRIRRNEEEDDDDWRDRLSDFQKARLHRIEVIAKPRYNRRGHRQSYKN